MNLTKESKKILYVLYKEYEKRRKSGQSRSASRFFSSASDIQNNFFPSIPLIDIEDSLRELGRSGFLNNFYADNTIYICNLSDHAITTMEELPKDRLISITDFIAKFIP